MRVAQRGVRRAAIVSPLALGATLLLSVVLGLLLSPAARADEPSPASDTVAPTTFVAGGDDLWHDTPVELTFSAADDLGGSGVAATYVKVDAGAYEPASSVTIAAPTDHADDWRAHGELLLGRQRRQQRDAPELHGAHRHEWTDDRGDRHGDQREGPLNRALLFGSATTWPPPPGTWSSAGDRQPSARRRAPDLVGALDGHDLRGALAAAGAGHLHLSRDGDRSGRQPAAAAWPGKVSCRGPWWRCIGRSVQGRAIVAAAFGSGLRHVLFIGGVHGNEYGTAVAGRFVACLCAHPKVVPAGARVVVIRCLNPDGHARGTRGNARHVDLNRNLPSRNWQHKLDPSSELHGLGLTGGASPGSEPETRALLACLRSGSYRAVISVHSRGGVLDCSGPGAAALGRLMAARCGFRVGGVGYDAAITGSLGDFVPERYGVPVVTVELRGATLTAGLRAALLVAARGG